MPTARGKEAQRIIKLAKEQREQLKRQIDNAWYSFVTRPTCPPSTAVHVHGGTCIESKSMWGLDDVDRHSGLAWTVPSLVRDLTDGSQAIVDMGFAAGGYKQLSWATADSYRGGILLLLLPIIETAPAESDWRLRLFCYKEEYDTPSEAEAKLTAWLWETEWMDWDDWYDGHYWPEPIRGSIGDRYYQETGMPLCGIILHNNGKTGNGRFFLPIDAINRGRSYTWPRDMRPQWVNK